MFIREPEIKLFGEALSDSKVTTLTLDTKLCLWMADGNKEGQVKADTAMKSLAEAIEKNDKFTFTMNSPEGYAALGYDLKSSNLFEDAKEYYNEGISKWSSDIRGSILFLRRACLFRVNGQLELPSKMLN